MQASSHSMMSHFRGAFLVTILGLVAGAWFGWYETGRIDGALSTFFICLVLAALEISLSFDNAVVNANVLKRMDPIWQRRFLTWGILIAVFGMRIIFPVAVVSIAAGIGPISSLVLAVSQPEIYSQVLHDAHPDIAAFGGAFLLMVALSFFFDSDKDVHWLPFIEDRCRAFSALKGVVFAIALGIILATSQFYQGVAASRFIYAALWGLMTFQAVDILGATLDAPGATAGVAKSGLGAFLYLEVLDASFSFDGVIGAFALTHNLFIIAIGLGIGAMYVRAMTIMLVERGILAEFKFLEHGAFYAILVLAAIMFIQPLVEVPETVTGLIGIVLIAAALASSHYHRERKAKTGEAEASPR